MDDLWKYISPISKMTLIEEKLQSKKYLTISLFGIFPEPIGVYNGNILLRP